MRIARQYKFLFLLECISNRFLSACSCPKTLIIQYRRLRRNFKKCKFRIWFCRLWKCFKNNNNDNKKNRFILIPVIHFFSNTFEGSCFLARE